MPTPPSLTPEQRAAALEKATRVRKERSEVKRELKDGSATLRAVLERASRSEAIAKMRVLALLESLPSTGKVKARRLLDQVGISESRRVQGLGANQRAELLRILGH
jgi:hypothetical protein